MIGNCNSNINTLKKLERYKKRLEAYYLKEEELLSQEAVKSYGIGKRNIERYDHDLAVIRGGIERLEKDISYLEGMLQGKKPRKTVAVIPRDW